MANVKQQLASLANSSGPSQKDRIEKYGVFTANTVGMMSFTWQNIFYTFVSVTAFLRKHGDDTRYNTCTCIENDAKFTN